MNMFTPRSILTGVLILSFAAKLGVAQTLPEPPESGASSSEDGPVGLFAFALLEAAYKREKEQLYGHETLSIVANGFTLHYSFSKRDDGLPYSNRFLETTDAFLGQVGPDLFVFSLADILDEEVAQIYQPSESDSVDTALVTYERTHQGGRDSHHIAFDYPDDPNIDRTALWIDIETLDFLGFEGVGRLYPGASTAFTFRILCRNLRQYEGITVPGAYEAFFDGLDDVLGEEEVGAIRAMLPLLENVATMEPKEANWTLGTIGLGLSYQDVRSALPWIRALVNDESVELSFIVEEVRVDEPIPPRKPTPTTESLKDG